MTHKILGGFVTVLALLFLFQVSPGISADNIVKNIVLTPGSPNILAFGEHVTITFDYSTTNYVEIQATPYSNDGPLRGAILSGSPVYSPGSGSGSYFFTFNRKVNVTKILIHMWDQGEELQTVFKAFITVDYKFR